MLRTVGDTAWPLRRAAALFEAQPAIVAHRRRITYGELDHRVRSLGRGLDEIGVAPGARVGFLGANSLAHLECWIGIPAAGRVLVSLNYRLSPAELAFIARDCELELLIVDRAQLDAGRALRREAGIGRPLVLDDQDDGEAPPDDCVPYGRLLAHGPEPARDIPEDELAAISYTGGTTGTPKGVMLSHANLLANARHNLIATQHARADRWLHVCPMFHVAGIANLLACTWVGALQVLLPRFDARAVIDAVRREEITHVVLVPTMLAMLLDELDKDDGGALGTLRHIQYAASPIAPALQRRVLERFDCDVVQFYGMTEAAPTVTQLPAEDHRRGLRGEAPYAARLSGIGVPVVGVEVDIRDTAGAPLAPGEVGELYLRGSNVMLGYWKRPQETEAALVDGWYRSGDAARADADGYLYVVDRLKDMIITGGENVYSVEVESALIEHPAVAEAAVFGIADARWGESVHAIVTLRAGHTASAEDLIEHCRTLIAGYKVPRSIELRDDPLPKSGAGKLLKSVLREAHRDGGGA